MSIVKRILIVDDEPNIRRVFRASLESAGYRVDEARDGEEALLWVQGSTPDLILLDLQMPNIGGMEVLESLRTTGYDIPVVIVTAHGSIPDAVAAMKLGAIDFLAKPLTPDVLRRTVAEVVGRHSAAAPEDQSVASSSGGPIVATVMAPVLDLTLAKRALNRRDFEEAERLLEELLDQAPYSAEAHTLLGVLQESRGQDHAAYHSYKTALMADSHYTPALDNLHRYCQRFGLDFRSKAINPAAEN